MPQGMGGSSMFLKELAEKLSYVRREVLSKYNVGELGQEWYVDLKQSYDTSKWVDSSDFPGG
jgi:hypothetical protein